MKILTPPDKDFSAATLATPSAVPADDLRHRTPAALGRLLTTAREKRRLSIQDAAHQTRIPAHALRQLEEGNIAAFGSITYARSFMRAYSAFLGVDPSPYLRPLPAKGQLGGERDYRYLVQSQGPWILPHEESETVAARRRLRPSPATRPAAAKLRRIASPLPAGLGVFALMLMATALWGMHVADLTHPGATPATFAASPAPTTHTTAPLAQAQTQVQTSAKPKAPHPISYRPRSEMPGE